VVINISRFELLLIFRRILFQCARVWNPWSDRWWLPWIWADSTVFRCFHIIHSALILRYVSWWFLRKLARTSLKWFFSNIRKWLLSSSARSRIITDFTQPSSIIFYGIFFVGLLKLLFRRVICFFRRYAFHASSYYVFSLVGVHLFTRNSNTN